MSKSLGTPVPLERPLTVGPVMLASFAFVTTPGWIVVVIDEFADLMLSQEDAFTMPKDVMNALAKKMVASGNKSSLKNS
jgi:hypothetical protein